MGDGNRDECVDTDLACADLDNCSCYDCSCRCPKEAPTCNRYCQTYATSGSHSQCLEYRSKCIKNDPRSAVIGTIIFVVIAIGCMGSCCYGCYQRKYLARRLNQASYVHPNSGHYPIGTEHTHAQLVQYPGEIEMVHGVVQYRPLPRASVEFVGTICQRPCAAESEEEATPVMAFAAEDVTCSV